MKGTTLYEKIWRAHLVRDETADAPGVIRVDLHLIHEGTSLQAFTELERRGLSVRRPDRTFATADHVVPTARVGAGRRLPTESKHPMVEALVARCAQHGIRIFRPGASEHGIVHVIAPELGLTLPGSTIVCGDSHTSTHGAFGALGFGIGTTEVGHVLATQLLLQQQSRVMVIHVGGRLRPGVSAKDLALAIIGKWGVDVGRGYVVEYDGPGIETLDMEQRMTLCNMTIEAGARAGMVAPDDKTFEYLFGRPSAPKGADWDASVARWRALRSDEDARFDRELHIDAATVTPMVTYGTNPGMAVPIDAPVPERSQDERARAYMGVEAGAMLRGRPVDVVFIGSCTNARISDLREAARILDGRKVAPNVRLLVVPGSQAVLEQAEREGLAEIFRRAGGEWRSPGCSMCIAMNGDQLAPREVAVSTSNRNFEGRQGPGSRTILASPATAAATSIAGCLADPRAFLEAR